MYTLVHRQSKDGTDLMEDIDNVDDADSLDEMDDMDDVEEPRMVQTRKK